MHEQQTKSFLVEQHDLLTTSQRGSQDHKCDNQYGAKVVFESFETAFFFLPFRSSGYKLLLAKARLLVTISRVNVQNANEGQIATTNPIKTANRTGR
jgi:hypothetical protein